jgi:Ring finger domain
MSVVFEANSGTGLNPFDSITGSMLRELLVPGSSLLGAVNELIGTPLPNIMEPVPVRPTAQQIATASTVSTVSAEQEEDEATEENTCAICQDVMAEGSQIRTLNSCEHAFHMGCIDTWFQRHVNCPVCRHDIREA